MGDTTHSYQQHQSSTGGIVKKNTRRNYGLCGYLWKESEKNFGSLTYSLGVKKRWFVYSDKNGKLYMYRAKNDPEQLGEIDISLSTFLYDLDNPNERQFVISSGNQEWILEASSEEERLFWLQQLQAARQEFTQRLHQIEEGPNFSLGRPKSGLLKAEEPDCVNDPNEDLVNPVPKPSPAAKFQHKSLLSTLSLPLSFFKPTPNESVSSPTSLCNTQENSKLDKVGQKLRNSVKLMSRSMEDSSSDPSCKYCAKKNNEIVSAYQEMSALRDSCAAGRDAINILQNQIEVFQNENKTLDILKESQGLDTDVLAVLREKDSYIVELESTKHKLKNSLSTLTSNLRNSRMHSDNLEEKLKMMTTLIEVKDQAIVQLTEHLQELTDSRDEELGNSKFYPDFKDILETKNKAEASTQTTHSDFTVVKDQLEGYRLQNSFLNKEILDLNMLRNQAAQREQKLIAESSEWEAKFYQIQSKYLLLLNDLHNPQSLDNDCSVVPRLLEDLVQSYGSTDLRGVHKKGKDYDEFGFCISAPMETDISTQAAFIQKRSMTCANQAEFSSETATLNGRWEAFIAGTLTKEMIHHPELKNLIRLGIPYQYKGKVWRLLINHGVSCIKSSKPSSYYQSLLSQTSTSLDPFAKQIEVDLLRTLPNNRHYESPFCDGIAKLRRVLLAYSRHNLEVGYCQGLNRLAAVALLFLNEEDAFWALVYIVEVLVPPSFYSNNLLGSQVDQRVLKDLIAQKLPNLHSHLEQHGLDVSLFTFNWFLCIYVDVIPPSTYLYVWDSFLYEGSKVLFRFALAIFKLCENDIMKKQDYLSIFNYLRSVPEPMLDVKQLHQIAFYWVNPLQSKYIKNRRDYYTNIVKSELDEVEASRQAFKEAASQSQVIEKPSNTSLDDWQLIQHKPLLRQDNDQASDESN